MEKKKGNAASSTFWTQKISWKTSAFPNHPQRTQNRHWICHQNKFCSIWKKIGIRKLQNTVQWRTLSEIQYGIFINFKFNSKIFNSLWAIQQINVRKLYLHSCILFIIRNICNFSFFHLVPRIVFWKKLMKRMPISIQIQSWKSSWKNFTLKMRTS